MRLRLAVLLLAALLGVGGVACDSGAEVDEPTEAQEEGPPTDAGNEPTDALDPPADAGDEPTDAYPDGTGGHRDHDADEERVRAEGRDPIERGGHTGRDP
jgi:hypothetical protein